MFEFPLDLCLPMYVPLLLVSTTIMQNTVKQFSKMSNILCWFKEGIWIPAVPVNVKEGLGIPEYYTQGTLRGAFILGSDLFSDSSTKSKLLSSLESPLYSDTSDERQSLSSEFSLFSLSCFVQSISLRHILHTNINMKTHKTESHFSNKLVKNMYLQI